MKPRVIALAGPTDDLGERVLKPLLSRGAEVCALVRTDASEQTCERLVRLGQRSCSGIE